MIRPSKISTPVPVYLNESYGIKEFGNDQYTSSINHFIKNVLRPELTRTYALLYDSEIPDIETGMNFKYFNISNLDCTWIRNLDIYVTRGDKCYAFVLSTFYDADGKKTYNIIRNGIERPPFKINGNVIEYMSIVMCIPFRLPSDEELFGIISHEIKHGFDYMRKDFINNYLNRDVIYANDFLISNNKIGTVPDYWYLEMSDLEYRIPHMNCFDVMCAICNAIYFLNSSEMSARLNNYKSELLLYKRCNMEYIQGQTRTLYERILQFLNKLIELIPENVKQEFSARYIKDFELIYSSDDGINDKSFNHRGNIMKSGFNNLMRFFMKKIKGFITNCDKIKASIL